MSFWIDEKEAASIRIGGYSYCFVAPGFYSISAGHRAGLINLPINLEANKSYYFRFSASGIPEKGLIKSSAYTSTNYTPMSGGGGVLFNTSENLTQIEKKYAEQELIGNYKYVEPSCDNPN